MFRATGPCASFVFSDLYSPLWSILTSFGLVASPVKLEHYLQMCDLLEM